MVSFFDEVFAGRVFVVEVLEGAAFVAAFVVAAAFFGGILGSHYAQRDAGAVEVGKVRDV